MLWFYLLPSSYLSQCCLLGTLRLCQALSLPCLLIYPSVLNLFLDEPNIPFIITPNPPIEFFVQPSDIFDASLRLPFSEQVEDEQVEDKLSNFEPGSPTLAPLEDLAQYIPPRHLTRVWFIFAHLLDYHCYIAFVTLHKSHTYCKASIDPLWQIAMKEELNALSKNHTWDLVTLPPWKSVVSCKWIYKTKTWSDSSIKCYKTCPLAKGFTQEYEIDYEETFCHTLNPKESKAWERHLKSTCRYLFSPFLTVQSK